MQKVAGRLVFSPSDLQHFLECEYVTHLDLEAVDGRAIEQRRTAEADLVASKGQGHEQRHLAALRDAGREVVEIADPESCDWAAAAVATRDEMARGADVIYQAVLLSGRWRGRADFLVRVESPSSLGNWSYEAWDTKLARHAKPSHVLQLASYSDQIAAIQGVEPEWMHLVLGSGEAVRFRCRDFTAYHRAVQRRFLRAVEERRAVAPYPVAHCHLCGYADHCDERWEAEEHLSLVANIRRSHVERLHEAGVRTVGELAAIAGQPAGIAEATLGRLRHQASLQAHFRATGEHRYDLLAASPENGFRLMPPSSPGDVFFDMEGFPFFESSGGLEYLFGAITVDAGAPRFTAFRAADRASEKRAFEAFVDFVWERLRRWPDLHVYHYAPYEPAALKRLMALHATRAEQVDELLRREVFVDLYNVVRRSLRTSHGNYSIKSVRQFFMPDAGKGEVSEGGQSVIAFQQWLDTGDARILDAIERYNEEDCVSTLQLRDWLLERRQEAGQQYGVDLPFASLPKRRAEPLDVEPDPHADLRARLVSTGDAWRMTAAHLIDYHDREAKPEWWAYFERKKKSIDELLEDTEAIARLTPAADPPVAKKQSLVYTLEFPPQEFKLKADSKVDAALGGGAAGTIEWIDAGRSQVGLRRDARRRDDPLPVAIIAGGPVRDTAQREAILRVVRTLDPGADRCGAPRGRYAAVRAILRRDAPRFSPARQGRIQTLDLAAQTRLVQDLDASYLVIQGPPGSGKTWTGARLVVALIAAGRRVGVTAPNHRAIHNLLEEIERVAAVQGVEFKGLKKRSTSDETAFDGRFITSVADNEECEGADAQLIAGTAWLFARAGMDQSLDYLFVDEAGQVALADAVAVGTAARNVVFLGDPQQLPHVTQNTHPEGAGGSVLEHLLGDAATVAEDRGLFLGRSWRMHPDVCRFVSEHSYDGRLASAPGCERQGVWLPPSDGRSLSGAGLRYVPVEHRHNAQQSAEEAAVIAEEVRRLLDGGMVTDRDGRTTPLTPSDILVVAPYNMQVRCLREALPEGVEVGTVDKFQGREAAVAFFSMASSSGEDVPRGIEFLFNANRFNVAVSRAKCLSVVVCSPRLLETRCRRVEPMALINALCGFADSAPKEISVSA